MSVSPSLRRIGTSLLQDLSIKVGRNKAAVLPMVVSIASSQWRRSGSLVDYQDVLAEALLGLVSADAAFKKGRGTKFSTYAHIRVCGATKDIIRREAANAKKHVLLDAQFFIRKQVPNTIERDLALQEQFEVVRDILRRELPQEQSAILVMFYIEDLSADEIAEELQRSPGCISKVKRVALAKVKEAMNKRGHYGVVE